MGCGQSRESPQKKLALKMYECFGKGDIKGILDAGSENMFFDFVGGGPYKGKHEGKAAVEKFFGLIGQHWGGPKGVTIEFSPSDFQEHGDSKLVNMVTIKQLTPGGQVIFGTETHTWTFKDGKWSSLTVSPNDPDMHAAAFEGKENQAIILCKMCWSLFGQGRTDEIIKHCNLENATFDLMAGEEGVDKVPYGGKYIQGVEGKGFEIPFKKMQESWVFDKDFVFKPTEFKANGNVVTMTAEIDCMTVGGKKIKGTETHTAVCERDANGILKTKSWTVSNGKHHIQAFAS